MEQRSAGGMTSYNVKTGAKPLQSVVAVWKIDSDNPRVRNEHRRV